MPLNIDWLCILTKKCQYNFSMELPEKIFIDLWTSSLKKKKRVIFTLICFESNKGTLCFSHLCWALIFSMQTLVLCGQILSNTFAGRECQSRPVQYLLNSVALVSYHGLKPHRAIYLLTDWVWLSEAADNKMHPINVVYVTGASRGAKHNMTLHVFITWLDVTSQIFLT